MRTAGEACSQANGNVCDGAGQCVACITWADCPGENTQCRYRTCQDHQCTMASVPAGSPIQTPGDCLKTECDGAGGTIVLPEPLDFVEDGLECTVDSCGPDGPQYDTKATGTPCSQGAGHLCEESACVPYIPFVCATNGSGDYPACDGIDHVVAVKYGGPQGSSYYCEPGEAGYCKPGTACKVILGQSALPGVCQ